MLYSGQDLIPSRYNDEGRGIPYITGASNLENKRVIINRWTETPTTHATKGDLLLTCKGSGVGKMAWCDIDDAHIARQIMALRCIEGLLPDYLELVMSAMITSIKEKANGLIPGLSRDVILDILSPIPPASEQERIVQSVASLILLIDQADQSKAELLETIRCAKSRILDLAIRGQLIPQDPDDEPASVLLERIQAEKEELIRQGKIKRDKKESIIFRGEDNSYYEKIGGKVINIDDEIPFEPPFGWEFVRLKELWELISGRDLAPHEYNSQKTGVPYITGASNFQDGTIELTRWTTSPQVITETGDLLLTCKGTVGEMAFNNFGTAHIARQIMAIRNTFDLNAEYLKLCLGFYIMAIKNAAKGLIPGVSREDILNLILPVPPKTYQAQVVDQVSVLMSIITLIEKSLN